MKLFQPDNFSTSIINYKALDPSGYKKFLPILELYFNNPEISYLGQLEGTEINSNNFKIELCAGNEVKTILLRKFKALENKEQIVFYLSLLRDLKDQGVRVSEVVVSKTGDLVAEYEKEHYAVFNFIEASHFKPQEEGYLAVAEAVAQMHYGFNQLNESCRARIQELSSQNKEVYFNKIKSYSASDFAKIEEVVKQKGEKSGIEGLLLAEIPFIKDLSREVKQNISVAANLPKKIIHSDLHPHNILMQGNKVAAIVDFDSVRISEQARDMAFALYRFGRQFFVRHSEQASVKAPRLKDLFLTHYQKIKPLTETEIRFLPILIKDEFLRKLLFVLRGVYEENNQTWVKDLPKFLTSFKEINYFWPNQ